jgi:hypothetical protein
MKHGDSPYKSRFSHGFPMVFPSFFAMGFINQQGCRPCAFAFGELHAPVISRLATWCLREIRHPSMAKHYYLVGGIPTPLKNMSENQLGL